MCHSFLCFALLLLILPVSTLYRVAPLQSSGCANVVMRLQFRNGNSDHAVGQWVIITIRI